MANSNRTSGPPDEIFCYNYLVQSQEEKDYGNYTLMLNSSRGSESFIFQVIRPLDYSRYNLSGVNKIIISVVFLILILFFTKFVKLMSDVKCNYINNLILHLKFKRNKINTFLILQYICKYCNACLI